MIVYTVYEPEPPAKDIEERAEGIAFVKEGFAWWGFLLGPVWLFFHALWFEFLIAVALGAGLAYGLVFLGLQDRAPGIVSLLLMLVIGFEGHNFRRRRLERKGYKFLAPVAGSDFEDCERRFFQAWLPSLPRVEAALPTATESPNSWGDWSHSNVVGTPGDLV